MNSTKEGGGTVMSTYDPSQDYLQYPTLAPLPEELTSYLAKCPVCGCQDFNIKLPRWTAVCIKCGGSMDNPSSDSTPDPISAEPTKQLPLCDFQIVTCYSNSALSNSIIILRPDGTLRTEKNLLTNLRSIVDWTQLVAIAAGNAHIAGLRTDGTVISAGLHDREMRQLESWTNITSITATSKGILGLRSDGTVCSVGLHAKYVEQLQKWSNIVSIAASGNCIAGIRSDGTVRTIGQISNVVYSWENVIAIALTGTRIVGLHRNGTVSIAGFPAKTMQAVSKWKNITAIAAYGTTVAAIYRNRVIAVNHDTIFPLTFPETEKWVDIQSITIHDNIITARRSDGFFYCTAPNVQRFIVENMD